MARERNNNNSASALEIDKAIVRDLDHAREQPPGPNERPNGFFHFKRYQQSTEITRGEIFADMFIGWVYDRWQLSNRSVLDSPLTEIGQARKNFMAGIMIQLIKTAMAHNGTR